MTKIMDTYCKMENEYRGRYSMQHKVISSDPLHQEVSLATEMHVQTPESRPLKRNEHVSGT